MAQIIQTVPGAADVSVEATSGLPQMTVRYNRGRIARYGLNIEKLNQYISSAFAGGVAGVIYEGERRFDLVVRLSDKKDRKSTRLNSSHVAISYAVFCLKKKRTARKA